MRFPKHRRDQGFSLIEIVIVLFLTGVMLFCVSGLTDRTFKTLKFLQEKSTTLESASLACQRLAQEMREMVTAPTLGATSVTFSKVIPSSPLGVGNDRNDPNPENWLRAYPSAQRASINYSMNVDKVRRRVNSEPSMDVAVDVNAFAVSQVDNPGNYLIRLTILEDRRAVVFEIIVNCTGVPRV
jgi:prepilin-type N-terminal cleavage/methylation domain-containing protein